MPAPNSSHALDNIVVVLFENRQRWIVVEAVSAHRTAMKEFAAKAF